jgi:hypothetical protein
MRNREVRDRGEDDWFILAAQVAAFGRFAWAGKGSLLFEYVVELPLIASVDRPAADVVLSPKTGLSLLSNLKAGFEWPMGLSVSVVTESQHYDESADESGQHTHEADLNRFGVEVMLRKRF